MSLIDPGPRSATVKALTPTECLVTTYDEFIARDQSGTLGRVHEDAGPPAAADERADRQDESGNGPPHPAVAEGDPRRSSTSATPCPARTWRRSIASSACCSRATASRSRPPRSRRASRSSHYMLRPRIEDCLNLWFGKSEQTDQEIWNRFGADVALASRRALRSLGARHRPPAPARRAGDHARPVPPQHVPRHAADVCLRPALPRARQARAPRRRERATCARSSGSSSAWR